MADSLPAGLTLLRPNLEDAPTAPTASVALPQGLTPVPTYLERAAPPVTEDPNTASTFMERQQNLTTDVAARLQGRVQEVAKTRDDLFSGDLRLDEAFIQTLGKGVVGPVTDVVGASLSWGASELVAHVPEGFKDTAKEYVKDSLTWLNKSVTAQEAFEYAKEGVAAYSDWRARNPQDAKTLESIVNIGSVLNPANNKPSTFSVWGDMLEASAARGRVPFVTALVQPARTRSTRLEQVRRTSQNGPLLRNTTAPTAFEQEVIEQVARLPVSPNRSPQYNYNVIARHNEQLGNNLEAELTRANVQINPQDLVTSLNSSITTMMNTTATLTGDAGQVATRVADYARTLFQASDGSAAGLLQARRDFDSWVRRQRGDAALNGEKLSAINVAVRTVRTTMNDVLDAAVPSAGVRASLRQQHLLYTAMDNVAEKAADEASTLIGRVFQNIHKATGTSLPTTPLAIAATASGLGSLAAAAWLPYLAMPLAATSGAALVYKGITSPSSRQLYADIFRQIGRAMEATQVPGMRVQLAKDRLALLELLKQVPDYTKEKETTQ